MIVGCNGSCKCRCGATGCPRACTSAYYTYSTPSYHKAYQELSSPPFKPHLIFVTSVPKVEITPNYVFADKYMREAKRVRRAMLSIQRVYSTKIKRNKKSILI